MKALLLLVATLGSTCALQLAARAPQAPLCRAGRIIAEKRLTRQEEEEAKAATQRALEAANAKREAINEVPGQKAPTSWADAGLPPEAPPPPAVPAFVSAAPLVVGGFSVLLFTLNAVGAFGEGPDLDALVEEWSKL